jgi:hypothetical protein
MNCGAVSHVGRDGEHWTHLKMRLHAGRLGLGGALWRSRLGVGPLVSLSSLRGAGNLAVWDVPSWLCARSVYGREQSVGRVHTL